jgi:hypothetical protein
MIARRIVAVSADEAFGKQLAIALEVVGGAARVHQTLDALDPGDLQVALWVLHLDGPIADAAGSFLPRLAGDCQAIVVLPGPELPSVVDAMQASERVAGVLVADGFDPRALSAMARQVLTGGGFGLEKAMRSGVEIHAQLVGDSREKALCMAQIAEFAERVGVPRSLRASIEQCIDELLMNALYDAPVGEDGAPIFRDVPIRTRLSLRTEQVVAVQYALDGRQLAVCVRDAYGSLERDAVLRVLHKCLHAEQPIDRRAGGAGAGLYLIAGSSTAVHFHVAPGVATEVLCLFDLEAPTLRLGHFGFFVEPIDPAQARAGGPARRFSAGALRAAGHRGPPAPGMRRVAAGLSIAIAAALLVIGAVAWSRGFWVRRAAVTFTTIPAGASIEIEDRRAGIAASGTLRVDDLAIGHAYAVVARLDGYQPKQAIVHPHAGETQVTLELQPAAPRVELDSEPSGATVEIAGKAVGATPLTLTSLAPGAEVAIVFKRAGYRDAVARLRVAGPGETTHLVQHLEASDDAVRVRLVSKPPGAQVIRLGQAPAASRTYTPAEVLVEAGQVQRFMLTMPNHVPLVIEPFTPTPGAGVLEKGGTLAEGAILRVAAARGGKVTVPGAPHCVDLAVPADCTLAPGSYTVEYVGPDHVKATRTIQLAGQDLTVAF